MVAPQPDGLDDIDPPADGRPPRTRMKMVAIHCPRSGNVTPHEVGQRILAKWGKQIERCFFVQESADELEPHIHLHGCVAFTEKLSIPFTTWNEVIGIWNPEKNKWRSNKYQKVRSLRHFIKYMTKEQGNPDLEPFCCFTPMQNADRSFSMAFFDPKQWADLASIKTPKCDLIVQWIRERNFEFTNLELFEEFGVNTVQSARKKWEPAIQYYLNSWYAKRIDWVPLPYNQLNPVQNRLYECINSVMPVLKEHKPLAVKHNVWVLESPPDYHKSGLMKHLGMYCTVLYVDMNPNFPLGTLDICQVIDILYIESWTGDNLPYGILEKLMDCDPHARHNIKGNTFMFRSRPLVVISTNVPMAEWYVFGMAQTGYDGQTLIYKSTIKPHERKALCARGNKFPLTAPLSGFPDPEAGCYKLPEHLIEREEFNVNMYTY